MQSLDLPSAHVAPDSLSLIQGEGEMADRIRSFDWAQTPLGPISSWSETLVGAVNLMLSSPFASSLYCGPEYVLLYNDHYCPFLSVKHPHALGTAAPLVWAEAWPLFAQIVQDAFERGKSISDRRALIPILVNGEMQDRWWTFGMSPLYEKGRIVGVVNPVVDDTAAFVAERELRRSQEELKTGLDAAGLGMWHFNPKTGVVVADEHMERLFGAPRADGKVDYWLEQLHPDDRERVAQHFAETLAGEHDYDIEYRILRNGEVRWLHSKGKAIGPKDDPDELFAIIEDVTERKLAETALRRTEKLAAVGRLASSIAHEINNPLESVTNLLYLVQHSDHLDQVREYAGLAERELRRVSLIANQTLRFHKQSTRPEPAFCYDLIGDSLVMFQGRLVNNRIIVEKRKRAEHPIQCFSGEIRQVLNNLIGNAIDAMPNGGRLLVRSREALEPKTGERGLVLTVADTGQGMDAEAKKRLFEAFFTTKGIGGTGLGLWVSCEIVSRHRGQLRFRSCDTPGKSGTVFTLFLPFREAGDIQPIDPVATNRLVAV